MSGQPIVGICAAWDTARWAFWEQPASIVADSYADAVRRAGGLPIALLPTESDDAEVQQLIDRIDGLLLIGGSDLEPALYGAAPSPRTEGTAPVRDRFEIALVLEALACDLPALGICRGLQILNVATGGTLHQHLTDGGYSEHRPAPGQLDARTAHGVRTEPDSLAALAAGELGGVVNSHHHQGVATVGKGGRVTARSPDDGAVEAVEWPHLRFALGVQWHPEALALDRAMEAFVTAAGTAADDAEEPETCATT